MDAPERLSAVVKIANKKGLHARASAKLVECAARFQSKIAVTKDGHEIFTFSPKGWHHPPYG